MIANHTKGFVRQRGTSGTLALAGDILPRLKGKIGIITNDANGQLVELSVYKTTK
mgnify:CR=1 FL=1